MSTPRYLPLTCANCRRTLRVRSAYLGRRVTCNYCDHQFLAPEVSASRSASLSDESPLSEAAQAPTTHPGVSPARGTRPKVERLLAQIAALRQRLERAEGWERTLGETECRHRAEIDELAHELRIASTQASHAVQREHAFTDQLRNTQQELDDLKRQLAPGDPRALQETIVALRQELDATEAERDRLAQERAEAELGLHSIHDHHRDQLDALQYDLQEATRWKETALERESALLGQIQDLRGKLDRYEQERDFDAGYDPQMTDELDPHVILEGENASNDSTRLREEVALLHEQLEVLKQQRDDAAEQAGMLRLDRDRLHGCLARLEARVQEVEEESRRATLQRASEAADGQRDLDAATHREFELRTQLDSIETPIYPQGTVETAVSHQPLETDEPPFTHQPTPPPCSGADCPDEAARAGKAEQSPVVAAREATQTDSCPTDAHRPENANPSPPERVLDLPIGRDSDAEVETNPETDRISSPQPLAVESPEARILHLRASLRVAHEASSKGPFSGPFFTRLARIWKRSGSAQ